MKYLPAFAALFAMVAQPLAAAERIELAPSSNWVINYDAESCALQRDFGEDGQKVFLELRSFDPSEALQWQAIVASKDFALGEEQMKYAIDPLNPEPSPTVSYDIEMGETYKGRMFDAVLGWQGILHDHYAAFVASTPDLTEKERALATRGLTLDFSKKADVSFALSEDFRKVVEKAQRLFRQTEAYSEGVQELGSRVNGLSLAGAFSQDIFLQTGALSKPIGALEDCLDELVTHWGVDVEAHKTLTRKAEPANPKRLAMKVMDKYPSSMVKAGLGEKLRLRIDVSAEGKATDCHLQMSISDEQFRKTACEQFLKVKYLPALDASGVPINSYYRQWITYRLR